MNNLQDKYVVTETRKAYPYEQELMEFSREAGLRYVLRQDRSLEDLCRDEGVPWVIVWEPEGPVLYQSTDTFFYHPNMAKFRLAEYRKGKRDLLVEAAEIKTGTSFLDCTMGLGADALVAAYAAGPSGRIVGIESSPIIKAIVKWGMKKYRKGPVWLKDAMDRIEIQCADHLEYLRKQTDNSFHVVYFDPMFRKPVYSSKPLSPLRSVANPDPVSIDSLHEACRVARCKVVIKERNDSPEFMRLGVHRIVAGKTSEIAYGIIDIE